MGKTLEFIIPFKGLSLGFHEFTYEVNDLFFEEIDYSQIKKGEVKVDLELEIQETMLIFNFKINGSVEVDCDRCLEAFDYPINGNQQLFVQLGESYKEETDEIIIIPKDDHEINITPIIYEYIHLLLPLQKMHFDDENGEMTCNKEMLKKLHTISEDDQIDPRWDILKKLKKD